MSISTGDPRRPAPKKSTTAAGGPAPDAAPADEPVGGVLPVKKTARAASAAGGAAGRTGSNGRTSTNGAKSTGGGATKTTGSGAAKTTATKTTPAKTTAAKTTAAKAAKAAPAKARTTSALVGGKGGSTGGKRGGRTPVTPVRVAQTRNWGPILLFITAGVVALAIVGIGVWPVISDSMKPGWREQAAAIPGIMNYLDENSEFYNAAAATGGHQPGVLSYPMSPPVGGTHNNRWQSCMGDVYTSEIAKEHAVHSLEHGAVWITYKPDLPQDQIDKLASKVEGREFMMMSPYPDLDAPISLQAWGYQLKVDSADDGRIDDFITALRRNASQEPEAGCSGGITEPSPVPLDI